MIRYLVPRFSLYLIQVPIDINPIAINSTLNAGSCVKFYSIQVLPSFSASIIIWNSFIYEINDLSKFLKTFHNFNFST